MASKWATRLVANDSESPTAHASYLSGEMHYTERNIDK